MRLSDRGQVCWAKHRTAGRSTTTWFLAEDGFAGAPLPVGACCPPLTRKVEGRWHRVAGADQRAGPRAG